MLAQITSKNLGNFQEQYLRWSSAIVSLLPLRFTVILPMFLKLFYYDFRSFTPYLGLFSTIPHLKYT